MDSLINTFFTLDVYKSDIYLDANEDVLRQIYSDGISAKDKLPIEFVFVTDSQIKLSLLREILELRFPGYRGFEIEEIDGNWELFGITDSIQMNLEKINTWNQIMWDLGFQYDCKLDGWHVAVN
jgi:hypothetical protein